MMPDFLRREREINYFLVERSGRRIPEEGNVNQNYSNVKLLPMQSTSVPHTRVPKKTMQDVSVQSSLCQARVEGEDESATRNLTHTPAVGLRV